MLFSENNPNPTWSPSIWYLAQIDWWMMQSIPMTGCVYQCAMEIHQCRIPVYVTKKIVCGREKESNQGKIRNWHVGDRIRLCANRRNLLASILISQFVNLFAIILTICGVKWDPSEQATNCKLSMPGMMFWDVVSLEEDRIFESTWRMNCTYFSQVIWGIQKIEACNLRIFLFSCTKKYGSHEIPFRIFTPLCRHLITVQTTAGWALFELDCHHISYLHN